MQVIRWRFRHIHPYSCRFGSTFGSLFGCNRGIRVILVTFGSILASIRIAIRLYSGCPKSIRVNSWRFCVIRNFHRDIFVSDSGCSLNHIRISFESTESFRFRPYSGKIGPNLLGRIRFWCNPCITGGVTCIRSMHNRKYTALHTPLDFS